MNWIEYFKGRELLLVDTAELKKPAVGLLYTTFQFSNIQEMPTLPEDFDQLVYTENPPVALLQVIDFNNLEEIGKVVRAFQLGLLFAVARSYYVNSLNKVKMFSQFADAKIPVYNKKASWLSDGLQLIVEEANKRI